MGINLKGLSRSLSNSILTNCDKFIAFSHKWLILTFSVRNGVVILLPYLLKSPKIDYSVSLILIQRLVRILCWTNLFIQLICIHVCMYVCISILFFIHCGLDSIFSVKRRRQIWSGWKKRNLKYYFNLYVCLSIHIVSMTLYKIRFLLLYQKMTLIKITTKYRGFCHLEILRHCSPVSIEKRLYLFLPMKLERKSEKFYSRGI